MLGRQLGVSASLAKALVWSPLRVGPEWIWGAQWRQRGGQPSPLQGPPGKNLFTVGLHSSPGDAQLPAILGGVLTHLTAFLSFSLPEARLPTASAAGSSLGTS